MNYRLLQGFYMVASISAGCLILFVGAELLDIRLELYFGIATFSSLWALDIFLVPIFAGIVVTSIYGLGGKMLSMVPPIIVHGCYYYQTAFITGPPENTELLPILYWVLPVIMTVEFAMIGGFLGEVFIKKIFGRVPKGKLYKPLPVKDNDSAAN